MEEVVNKFLAAFGALSSGKPEEIQQADKFLQEMTLDPRALVALVVIATKNENPMMRARAILTIRLAARVDWDKRDNQGEFLQQLLQALSQEPELQNRKFLATAIAGLVRPGTYDRVLTFVRFAMETKTKEHIWAALWLMSDLIGMHPSEPSVKGPICELADALAVMGIESGDPDVVLDALAFAYEFNAEHVKEITEKNKQFWSVGVAQIERFIGLDEGKFRALMSVLSECVAHDYMFIDVEALFPVVVRFFLQDGVDAERLNSLALVLNDVMQQDPDYVQQSEFFGPMVQKFVKMAVESYSPDDTFEMSEMDTLETICSVFASSPEFMETLWKSLVPTMQSPCGICIAGLVMLHSFAANPEFFASSALPNGFEGLVEFILAMLTSEVVLIHSIGIDVMIEFVSVYSDDAGECIERIEETFLELLQKRPSVELVVAFDRVLAASGETDDIFESAYPLLKALIEARISEYGVCAIDAIRSLIDNSDPHGPVFNAFEDIISMMQKIIGSGKAEFLPMIDGCVECIARLSAVAPEKFAPFVGTFVATLSTLVSSEEKTLKSCCINAFGILLVNFAKEIESSAEPMLKICYELSGLDDTAEKVEQIFLQARDGGTDADFEDEPVPTVQLEMPGGALMLMASLTDYYPPLLQACLPQLLERIEKLSVSLYPGSRLSALKAIVFVVKSMQKNHYDGPEALNRMFMCCLKAIDNTDDTEEFGYCLNSIARIIETSGIGPVENSVKTLIPILEAGFDGNLRCMANNGTLDPSLFGVYTDILEVIMSAAPGQCSQVLSTLMPHVMKMAEAESPQSRSFALTILRTFAEIAEGVDLEFKGKVLTLALQMTQCKDASTAFYTIKQFVRIAPELVQPHVQQILTTIDARITTDKKRLNQEQQKCMDNVVSCLSVIASELMKDSFPIGDLVMKVLTWMPATYDVGENKDILNFVMWLLNREGAIQQFGKELLAVFVRFFTMPEEDIAMCDITGDVLEAMKAVFRKLTGLVPDGLSVCQHLCRKKSQFERIKRVLEQ